MLSIEQKISVLSDTINLIHQKFPKDPCDVELRATCIKIRQHLLDNLHKNNPSTLATCNYCRYDYREDKSTPPDTKDK